jgi:hypothetical protein
MQSQATRRESALTPFNVLTLYADLPTGKLAKRTLDYVAEQLGDEFEFRHSMWRLDILQDPELAQQATPAFEEADLLIVSISGEGKIPAEIRALIDAWLAGKASRNRALVALLETKASTIHSSVYASLAKLARRHGLEHFEQAITEPEDQGEAAYKLVWVF